MSRASERLRCAALAGALALIAVPSSAAPAVQQVLLLQSSDRGSLIFDHFTANFRVDLERLAGSPVNVVQVVVGPTGFVGAPDHAVVDYVRSTFTGRPMPDLIVTIGGTAAVFARQYRQQLFPDRPLLFTAVDKRYLAGAPLAENEAAVTSANDFPKLVEDILQLLPRTRQLFVVIGSGQLAQFWHAELGKEFQQFQDRLTPFPGVPWVFFPGEMRSVIKFLQAGNMIFMAVDLRDGQRTAVATDDGWTTHLNTGAARLANRSRSGRAARSSARASLAIRFPTSHSTASWRASAKCSRAPRSRIAK